MWKSSGGHEAGRAILAGALEPRRAVELGGEERACLPLSVRELDQRTPFLLHDHPHPPPAALVEQDEAGEVARVQPELPPHPALGVAEVETGASGGEGLERAALAAVH